MVRRRHSPHLFLFPPRKVQPSLFLHLCIREHKALRLFSSVQLLSHVRLFETPWTTARQASLSITNSRSLLKLMSIELVMPSNHLILCCPLLLPSIFPSIRVFSNESVLRIRWPKDWSFSFSIRVRPRHVSMNKSYRFLTWREPGTGGKGGGPGG